MGLQLSGIVWSYVSRNLGPLGPLGAATVFQISPERPREVRRGSERPREAQRSPESLR